MSVNDPALAGKSGEVVVGRAVNCDICGQETGKGGNQKYKTSDGIICQDCYYSAGFPASVSVSLMSTALVKEQLTSADGLSIVKRYKMKGGEEPLTAPPNQSNRFIKCPRCASTQISADKKGFGIGKAVIGVAFAGPIGLVAGNMGAKKVRITCLKCGKSWNAGG